MSWKRTFRRMRFFDSAQDALIKHHCLLGVHILTLERDCREYLLRVGGEEKTTYRQLQGYEAGTTDVRSSHCDVGAQSPAESRCPGLPTLLLQQVGRSNVTQRPWFCTQGQKLQVPAPLPTAVLLDHTYHQCWTKCPHL